MTNRTDAELLDEFRTRRSESAFTEIVRRHSPLVLGTARRILTSEADAADAAQAAFIALALRADRLDASRGLTAWLHTVTTRAALDIRRSALRRLIREDAASPPSGPERTTDGIAARLDDAIRSLPRRHRETVLAHYFDELTLEEIATREACSPSAISMRLTRARELLRRRLNLPCTAILAAALDATLRAVPSTPFAAEATRLSLLAVTGAQSSEAAGIALLATARRALRPSGHEVAGPAVLSIVVAVALCIVPLVVGHAAPGPKQDTLPSVETVIPASSPTTGAAPASANAEEHPLFAGLKTLRTFEQAPEYVRILDRYPQLDAIRDPRGRTPLHVAIIEGHEDFTALMLHRGAGANVSDNAGYSALMHATIRGQTWTILLLILRGAEVDHVAADGSTALGHAVRSGDQRHAEILLWAGANPAPSPASATWDIAHLAAQSGNPELQRLVKDYVFLRTDDSPVNPMPAFVKDSLHQAAARGDFPALAAYLQPSGGANVRDKNGRTPLFDAIRAGQPEVVFYLLMMGADPNATDRDGRTPLGATMGWLGGGLDAMRYFLLACGANPNAVRGDGHTELTWTAIRDNEHGMQFLLWLHVDPWLPTKHGTAFQVAVHEGNQRIIDLLRRHGIDEPITLGGPPEWQLHNAAKRGDLSALDTALATGVPIDIPDERGNTAFIVALHKRNVAAARHLLARGANLNFVNSKTGETPLYATTGWDFSEMTNFREEMLRAGANVNVTRLSTGETPLMRTVWHQPTTPLKQLLKYGADLNARDANGRSVLQRAIAEGKLETADYLRRRGAVE